MIPVVGSFWESIHDFSTGHWFGGIAYAAMGVLDLSGVGEIGAMALEGALKISEKFAAKEGIIYLRTSAKGGEYIGQAESAARYAERQLEHAARNPTESFTFQELERVPANSGRSLNVAEEDWIRAGGGAKSTGGRLENARHQLNELDYRTGGGTINYP